MKAKTVVIALLVTAAAAGGIGYGVYYSMQSNVDPVNVVPVENVNFGYWGDSSTSYGSVISMDSQSVELSSEYELVKVYVETGDEVKIGDPLLEYDMTLLELKKQMEELTKQSLEINLAAMEKQLKKLQNTTPTASLDINTGTMTASGEELFEEAGEISDGDTSGNSGTQGNNGTEGGEAGSQISGTESGTSGSQGTSGTESGTLGDQGTSGDDDKIINDSTTDDEDFSDSEGETSSGTAGDTIIEDGTSNGEADVIISEDVITEINSFLTRVNQLSEQDLDSLIASDISEALRIFREKLSVSETREEEDIFGETRTITTYSVNPAVAEMVGETTASVLLQAYDRACVYQLIYCMKQLNPEGLSADELTDEEVRALEEKIRTAADAYYSLQQGAFADYEEVISSYTDQLAAFVARLNHMDVVEETEASTEAMTEYEGASFGDFGDFGDYSDIGGDGLSYTAEELKEAIADQEREIEECQLQIRESELKLKQYQRQLDNKIITSNMNGVVKSAGTVDEAVVEDAFIVITGASGMYVQGTLNELKLDSVKVGDTVQGMSYESGTSFTAEITEISPYPVESDSYYYGYGSENTNASYYPYLAYIEDAEDLMEGEAELQIVENTVTTGIYLEKYFILEEKSGKEYVYIQGEDGLLKKQYVETGIIIYGMAKEIKSGVSSSDKIAFPYGKNVVEGAPTREVDSLYSDYYYG